MCHGVITQGKNRMRQFRTSGSVRGAAREGGSYRDTTIAPLVSGYLELLDVRSAVRWRNGRQRVRRLRLLLR